MKERGKKYSAYYQYLKPFLENGNDDAIKKAKKDYRRKYKAEWRKQNRKINKELTIPWTKNEKTILSAESKRHKLSNTRFIKKAVMAYIDKRYIVPNQNEVNKMLQLIALTYNSIEEMQNEDIFSQVTAKNLQNKIDQLERDIRIAIFSPKTIEQVITEVIKARPTVKQQLIQFIETIM